MTTPDDQEEWITINEAVRLSGKSKATLFRWVAANKVRSRIEKLETPQAQNRVLFRRSDLAPFDPENV